LKETIDLLIQTITQDQDSSKIVEAKRDYQKLAGEIYEDDKSYEARMGLFLEWYIFDRKGPGNGETPFEMLIAQNRDGLLLNKLKNVENFADNIHGLFVVKKIRDNEVVALNLLDDKKYSVKEKEGNFLFHKNDLFEGRIISIKGDYYFSGNFCFHPKETEKFIKSEAKKINSVRGGYLKELKKFNSQLKDLNSRLEKNAREVEKINLKIQKANSMEKIESLNEKLEALKKVRAELTQQVSRVEADKSILETQKIKIKIDELISQLIQRLSYMNLKWERSRQIDLNDIYHN